jgi:hypothetical protein
MSNTGDADDFSDLFGQVGPKPADAAANGPEPPPAGPETAGAAPPPSAPASLKGTVTDEDFLVYGPSRSCIYLPCRTPWPNASVNEWLPWTPKLDPKGNPVKKRGKVVMQSPMERLLETRRGHAMSWSPGDPEFIHDRLPVDAGWVTKAGAITFNSYRPPVIQPGNGAGAQRWVDHWYALYPDSEAAHVITYLAHLVQKPGEKINHCIVLGGHPKIGKDTLLEPIETAVGSGNYKDITLNDLVSKNNEFLRAVFVRVSEARDLGEQGRVDRYALYDRMKNILARPPNMLRINEKYIREYYIVNCFGMIVTTNYRDAFYLTPEDRRHFVMFSEVATETYEPAYWAAFWHWYREENGLNDVVAFLRSYDISGFDPKAPPPKTPAFWTMVNADRGEEHGALLDAIEKLNEQRAAEGKPIHVVTIRDLAAVAPGLEGLRDARMGRRIGKQLGDSGFVAVDNPTSAQGLWVVDGQRQRIYAWSSLSPEDRGALASARAAERNGDGDGDEG